MANDMNNNDSRNRFQVDPERMYYLGLLQDDTDQKKIAFVSDNKLEKRQPENSNTVVSYSQNKLQKTCSVCKTKYYEYVMNICVQCNKYFCELCYQEDFLWNHEVGEKWCKNCCIKYESFVPTDYSSEYREPPQIL